jgi:hypothetical protein
MNCWLWWSESHWCKLGLLSSRPNISERCNASMHATKVQRVEIKACKLKIHCDRPTCRGGVEQYMCHGLNVLRTTC